MTLESPIRYTGTLDTGGYTKRAWWLIVLGFLLPGLPQLLAGSKKLGRLGILSTLLLWIVAGVTIYLWFADRNLLLGFATNTNILLAIQIALFTYAVLWLLLFLNTLSLLKIARTKPGPSRIMIALAALVAVALPVSSAAWAGVQVGAARDLLDSVFGAGEILEPVDGRYNILLLGGDAGEDRFGLRPDSISIASIDADTGQISLIGIPRNMQHIPFSEGSPLWSIFPKGYDCGDECLISYLYTEANVNHPGLYPEAEAAGSNPGVEATIDGVEGLTGVQIQYYVLIDMQGFDNLIDALGGVTINVKERLPIGGKKDTAGNITGITGWIEAGVQKMDGYTALWYARSRVTTSDYDRMLRQRELQETVLKQFDVATVVTRFQSVAEAGKNLITTNIPAGMVPVLLELADEGKMQELSKLELTPPTYTTYNPNIAKIKKDVAKFLIREELTGE
ncbi:MAG: LCP family protein [Microbacteriaceae bacterium]|nr:LCP family protein [Microbacteriaceae bacterium]